MPPRQRPARRIHLSLECGGRLAAEKVGPPYVECRPWATRPVRAADMTKIARPDAVRHLSQSVGGPALVVGLT